MNSIQNYYRCPTRIDFQYPEALDGDSGYFKFGPDLICYGESLGETRPKVNGQLFDAAHHVRNDGDSIILPFDPIRTADNLRYERYASQLEGGRWIESAWIKSAYYRARPLLPTSIRQHLQRMYLRDWSAIPFPEWPVDRSVDILFEKLLVLAMKRIEIDRLPFIWFWPEGRKACAILTHDVETEAGQEFCQRLMDIDSEFGFTAAFQIVPEKRYAVSDAWLDSLGARGAEINLHGLDHNGNLFADRQTFLGAAEKINRYAELYGSRGFRSPTLYRNVDWFSELNFSYDMSLPNVARLEAQRGGCCTVMPFFLPAGMLELPLTLTEDYTLFHMLGDYSTTLWKRQIQIILGGHGLIGVLTHPDYLRTDKAQRVYRELLEELVRLREDGVWMTLPGGVDRWWRERSRMELVKGGEGWCIEGQGSERARVAYACLDGDRLTYEIDA